MGEPQEKEWYSNKQLYEMMVELSKGLEATNAELGRTQVLIRGYNGLREKLDKLEIIVQTMVGNKNNLQWWATFVVAIAAVAVAVWK